jgi:autotransporter-associated beta strand protein
MVTTLGTTTDDSYDGFTTITVKNGGAFNFNCSYDNQQTVPHNFVVEGAGPDGLGAIRNDGCAVNSATFISNVTFTADTVLGAAYRWDIGPMAGSTIDGKGFKLTKVGTAILDLRAQTITNLPSITISNGAVRYESYNQTNSWTATTTNYVKPGTALGVYGGYAFGMPVVLDGATIRDDGGGTPIWLSPIRLDSGSAFDTSAAQNFYGPISGPGAMWVNGGTNALTLSNANSYAGGTIISNAPVTTSAADATAGSAAVIAKDPSAFGNGPITINGSAYPSLSTNALFFLTNVFRAVEFAFSAPGTAPNNIVLPSATINNVSLHGRDSGQVINLTGQISGGFTGMTNWIDFGDANVVGGVMRYGNAASTFLGNITVFRGWLAITGDGSLGNAANVLRLSTSGGLRIDAPGVNVAHPLYMTATTYLNTFGDNNGDGVPDTANTATISGVLSGAQRIRPIGGGTVILTATNTHSGTETWTPGAATVEFANVASLGSGFFSPNWGGTFRYTGTGSQSTPCVLWIDNAGPPGGGTIEVQSPTGVLTLSNSGGTINQPFYKTGPGTLILTAQGISGGTLTVNGGAMTVGGAISGAATVVQVNNSGTLTLNAANTYNGGTFVNSGGTLFVNGSLPAANFVTIASGGTLGGNGTINCPVNLGAGGFLAPGVNAIGKLTVNSTLALAGQTMMEINGTSGTNDSVVGLSEVSYGGTLTVNNLGGTPVGGAKFTLFSAANRLGSFAAVNLPALPANVTWANLLALDGSIQVIPTAATLTNVLVGNTLQLSWPANSGWRLFAQTNAGGIDMPTNWYPVTTSGNSISIPINTANPSVFYRLIYP